MKPTQRLLILISILMIASLACQLVNQVNFDISEDVVKGSGNVVSEPRPVSGFSRVELAGIGEMEVTFGDQEALTITAEANLLPLITSEVRGDTLVIGLVEGKTPMPTHPIRYDLTVTSLEAVSVPGLSDVHVPPLSTDRFEAEIPGAGTLTIDSLEGNSLEARLPGLGSLKIGGGTVQQADIEISGAGGFEAPNLQIAAAEVSISGLGSATVRVSESLTADISGSGSVKYYGSPAVQENVSGLGSVEKVGD